MKNKQMWLLLLLIALGHIPKLQAQSSIKDVPSKNWEVGMDVLGLVGKNNLKPFSVLLRKNYETAKHNQRAFRLRVGIDYTNNSNFSSQKELNLLLRAGYEFQKKLAHNLNLNYGLDASYDTEDISTQQILGLFGVQYPVPSPSKVRNIGFSGFIGIRYFISPKISVSTECNLSVLHRSYYYNNYSGGGTVMIVTGRDTTINNQPLIYLGLVAQQSTNIKISPFQTINFSFHF